MRIEELNPQIAPETIIAETTPQLAPETMATPTPQVAPEYDSDPRGDPIPFDLDGFMNDFNSREPIDRHAYNRDAMARVMFKMIDPFEHTEAFISNTMASMQRATANLFCKFDLITQYLDAKGFGTGTGFSMDLAKIAQKSSNYWRQRVDAVGIGYLAELISETLGEAVPGVVSFLLDVGSLGTFPYMAGARSAEQRQTDIRKQKDPWAAGMVEAARTGILAALFTVMGPLAKHLKAPAFATVFGLQGMEGAPEGEGGKAFAREATKGLLFAAASPGGRLGVNEIYENAKPLLESAKNMVDIQTNLMGQYGPNLLSEAGGGALIHKGVSSPNAPVVNMKPASLDDAWASREKSRDRTALGFYVKEDFRDSSHYYIAKDPKLDIGYILDITTGEFAQLWNESGIKGAGKYATIDALEHGASYLEVYGGFHNKWKIDLYESHGWVKVDETTIDYFPPGWDAIKHGNPTVITMEWNGERTPEGIRRAVLGKKAPRDPGGAPGVVGNVQANPSEGGSGGRMGAPGDIAGDRPGYPDRTVIPPATTPPASKTTSFLGGEAGSISLDIIPPFEKRESFYQNMVNRFASIENLDARAKALGHNVKPGESPRMRSREYLGLSGKVQSILRDKTYRINSNGKIEITGEGLKPILDTYDEISPEKNFDVKQQELNDYLIAVRTIEDLQRPKADWDPDFIVTPAQVAKAHVDLANLRAKYGNLDHFTAVADRFYSYSKRVLHSLVDSGVMSESTYQDIISKNPHYVPFDRVLEDAESSFMGPQGKKPFTEARTPVKKIMGSELEIEDVIGSYIKNTYRIINVAERNTVDRTVAKLLNLRDNNGVNLLGIERVNIPVRPIHVDPKEIDTITNTFKTQAQQILNQTQQTSSETTVGGGGAAAPPTTSPMTALETIVKESLERRGFTTGEAEAALNRIKVSAASKPTAEGATTTTTTTVTETIEKIIKETVNVIEAPIETTIWRPSPYTPKGNVIEYYVNGKKQYMEVPDNLYESMTGLNEVSSDFLVKIFSAPAKLLRTGVTLSPEFMLRNFVRDQWDAFIQNKVGFRPVIDPVASLADIMGKTDVYYDWLRSGGAHSTFVDLSRDNLKHMTNELQKDPSAFRHLNIISTAQQISQAIEQATRLGIYKAGVRRGVSDVEAGFAAREGTVDFAVRGQNQTLKNFSSMTAFFNPAIQGTDRFMRAHKEDPIGATTKAIASVTIPSVLLHYMNKDDPDYKELPNWQKNIFWHIRVKEGPEGFARIPRPFLWGAVYGAAPDRFLEYLETKDPKAFKGFMKSLLDAATPVQGDPNGILLPTFAKPLIENAADWQFFRERPVVPVSRKNLLPEFQYGKYTGETARQIGKAMGWSPAKIENFVTGYSGTTGAYVLKAADMSLEALQGKEKGHRPTETADIPIIKAFATRSVISDPQSLRDFYDNAKQVEAEYASFRDSAKNLRDDDVKDLLKNHPKLMIAPSLENIKSTIALLDRIVLMTSNSVKISDEKKRETIAKMETVRLKIAQASNKIMEGKVSNGETVDLTKSLEEAKGIKP